MVAPILMLATSVSFSPSQEAASSSLHAADQHCASARTQADMNDCYATEYRKADAELNRLYTALLAKATGTRRQQLQRAERAWVTFRGAHLEAIYPDSRPGAYGSVHPMCVSIILLELTVEHNTHLRRLLDPGEGNVCQY